MPTLNVEGASLTFELQGQGPLLLFIAGARGSGISDFKAVANQLSKSFSVITYDRRGFSQSPLSGAQDYEHRLERDADDAVELLYHVGSEFRPGTEAYVFGSSSGAIVALALLSRHHFHITKLIAHEPPWYNAFEDREAQEELAKTQQTYDLYRAKGVHAAFGAFASINLTPKEMAAVAGRAKDNSSPYDWGNLLYWFERELPVYPFADAPWETLQQPNVKNKLIMGISVEGGHLPAGQTARKMAEKLGPEVALRSVPGGHLGYYTDVESFSTCLEQVLLSQAE